jgi:hypothetical protein
VSKPAWVSFATLSKRVILDKGAKNAAIALQTIVDKGSLSTLIWHYGDNKT